MPVKLVLFAVYILATGFHVWLEALNLTVCPEASKARQRRRFRAKNTARLFMVTLVMLVLFMFEGAPSPAVSVGFVAAGCITIVLLEAFPRKGHGIARSLTGAVRKRILPIIVVVIALRALYEMPPTSAIVVSFAALLSTGILGYLVFFGLVFPRVFGLIPYNNPFDRTISRLDGHLGKHTYMLVSKRFALPPNAALTSFFTRGKIFVSKKLLHFLKPEEITGILAHEIGHAHRKHMRMRVVVFVAMAVVHFIILHVIYAPLFVGFFKLENTFVSRLTLIYVVFSVTGGIAEWGLNALARRQENEADAFVRDHGLALPLASALTKLGNLGADDSHHPLYARFKATHPPLGGRIETLLQQRKRSPANNAPPS